MMTLQESRISRWILVAGAGFAVLAVMIGAFAAHGLKQVLDAYGLGLFETAARYQMYHALALLIVAVFSGVLEVLCQFFNVQHNAVRRIDYDREI
jgi:uncharacterized membrane protein YgdD (TMEM256/DUF423 family)